MKKIKFLCLSLTILFGISVAINGLTLLLSNNKFAFASSDGSKKIVTIYDDHKRQTVITSGLTVQDVLIENQIMISASDIIEPELSTEISSNFNINIFRARPITVIDNEERIKLLTPFTLAKDIANAAGIVLYSEDEVKFEAANSELAADLGSKMVINRANRINLDLYGETSLVRSRAKTVGEFIAEKEIRLVSEEFVQPALTTKLKDGINIVIWQEGQQEITQEEQIAFTTRQISNHDLAMGHREIKQAGVNGKKLVTYVIDIKNKQEISRRALSTVVITPSIEQIEVVGAKGTYTTPLENQKIIWDFLMQQGFSRFQTAGIMGNLQQEHHFKTSDARGGLGIAQWTGARRKNLLSRPNPTNIYTQLNYLMEELNGTEKAAKIAILNSTTLEGAVRSFQNKFERCGDCRENTRIKYARNILASH